MITIYDINLEFLNNIDYNKIKKGNGYNLEKLLYIFICKNDKILDYIYKGDKIMMEIKDEFKSTIKELDEMLYYDPEELKKMIIEEEREQAVEEGIKKGHEKGLKDGIKQGLEQGLEKKQQDIIKNMYDKKYTLEQISDVVNLPLEKVKSILNI